jgi:hypothetical protein
MLVNIIYLLINTIIITNHEMSFVHWCRVSQFLTGMTDKITEIDNQTINHYRL